MNGFGGAFALDLLNWVKRGRKVKVAGRRLLPRPTVSKKLEKMNASMEGAC